MLTSTEKSIKLRGEIVSGIVSRLSIPSAKLEVDARTIEVDETIIEAIIAGAFWSSQKSKLYLMGSHDELVMFSRQDGVKFLKQTFGDPLDPACLDDHLDAWAAKQPEEGRAKARANKRKECVALPYVLLMDHLLYHNQRNTIEMQVDMFATHGRMELLDESARVVYTHTPFQTGPWDQAVVDDFTEHFPEYKRFLGFIVASRFAQDRKQCYIWMNCSSDWGKSFLLACLADMGVVVEVSVKEIEALFEGKPVSKTMHDFKRAMVLAVEEFKSSRSELKQLQNQAQLSPKNQLMQKVELFTKLFLSAEAVPSFASAEEGIEDQFANRVNYIRGEGRLNDRELFKRLGKAVYYANIRNFTAHRMNDRIEKYQALGREKAVQQADKVITKFWAANRIGKTFTPLSENLPALGQEFLRWLRLRYFDGYLSHNHKGDVRLIQESLMQHEGEWYLRNASKIASIWLDEVKDKSVVGALQFKKADIIKSVTKNVGTKSHRTDTGAVIKAAKLDLSEEQAKNWVLTTSKTVT